MSQKFSVVLGFSEIEKGLALVHLWVNRNFEKLHLLLGFGLIYLINDPIFHSDGARRERF